jgi:hypothetical protein
LRAKTFTRSALCLGALAVQLNCRIQLKLPVAAFILTKLLVVIAIIALLAATVLCRQAKSLVRRLERDLKPIEEPA